MGAVMQEIMIHEAPKEYDERTYIELLIGSFRALFMSSGRKRRRVFLRFFTAGKTRTEAPFSVLNL